MTAAFSGDTLYEPGLPLLAPIAGHTDLPMRLSARRHGCRYAFTEMVDAASLRYARDRAAAMLLRGDLAYSTGTVIDIGGGMEIARL